MDDKQRREFADLALRMEPENCSQDGELSRSESIRRYASYCSKWSQLELKYKCFVEYEEPLEQRWDEIGVEV